jgi:hypothetical protein
MVEHHIKKARGKMQMEGKVMSIMQERSRSPPVESTTAVHH